MTLKEKIAVAGWEAVMEQDLPVIGLVMEAHDFAYDTRPNADKAAAERLFKASRIQLNSRKGGISLSMHAALLHAQECAGLRD